MSVETVNFMSQISDFVRETQERIDAVFKLSTERVIEKMQLPVAQGGNMPVDTNFLRASGRASINAPLPLDAVPPKEKTPVPYSTAAYSLIIQGAKLGDTIYFCYTAVYAARINYGFEGQDSLGRTYNQAGRQFVGLAAQQWNSIVNEVSAELQTRIQGSKPAQEL